MASLKLMTRFPSNSIPGNDLGLAPVASMILSASMVSVFCLFFTSRDVLEVSFPIPVIWVILFFFIKNSIPLLRRLDISRLR